MTIPIKELGGLTDAEIQLRISEANERQAAMLEDKLKDHAEVIDKRLCATDQTLREVGKQYHELRTDVALLVESDKQKKSMLEELIDKGERWHESSLELHAVMVQRISKVETEQTKLADLASLRWVAVVTSSAGKVLNYLLETENFRFFFVAGLIGLILRSLAPTLLPHALHMFHVLK